MAASRMRITLIRETVVRDGGVRHELLMARLGRATASPGLEGVQASWVGRITTGSSAIEEYIFRHKK
jgi:hypothetical protein